MLFEVFVLVFCFFLQCLFLIGLLILLLIWLIWVVVKFVFVLFLGIFSLLVVLFFEQIVISFLYYFGWVCVEWIQNIIVLFVILLVILVVGVVSCCVFGQCLLCWVGVVIKCILLVSIIYDSVKKLLDMLQIELGSIQCVVLIDFLYCDMKLVGLVICVIKEYGIDCELVVVYVLIMLNLILGYLEIVLVELLILIDWIVDQVMSFIIFGGVVVLFSVLFMCVGECSE